MRNNLDTPILIENLCPKLWTDSEGGLRRTVDECWSTESFNLAKREYLAKQLSLRRLRIALLKKICEIRPNTHRKKVDKESQTYYL